MTLDYDAQSGEMPNVKPLPPEQPAARDSDLDGIPDYAEITKTITRAMPDGTSSKMQAFWQKMPEAPQMKVFDPNNLVPDSRKAYIGTLGTNDILTMRSRNTSDKRDAAAAIAGGRSDVAQNNALAQQNYQNQLSTFGQLATGEMKLMGEQAQAGATERAGAFKATMDFLSGKNNAQMQLQGRELELKTENQRPKVSPDGRSYVQNGQIFAAPQAQSQPPPNGQQVLQLPDGNAAFWDGTRYQQVSPRKIDDVGAQQTPTNPTAGMNPEDVRARIKQANPNATDAQLATLYAKYGV